MDQVRSLLQVLNNGGMIMKKIILILMVFSSFLFPQMKKSTIPWFLRGSSSSGSTDTSSLSNRIDAKVAKSDSNAPGGYQSYSGTYRTRLDTAYGIPMLNSAKDSIIYSGLKANSTKDTLKYNNVQIYPSSANNMTSGAISESLKVTQTGFRSYKQAKYFTSFFDDFEGGGTNTTAFSNGWTATAVNSATAPGLGSIGSLTNADSLYLGFCTMATGTNAAGASILQRTNSQIVPGNGLLQFEAFMRIPVLRSVVGAGGQQFWCSVGFSDKIDGTYPTDAVIFLADSLTTQWKCVTVSNGTADTASVGLAIVADQMYKLRADVNAYVAHFYLDDVLVRTVTSATAVPNGINRVFAPQITIAKIGGATARTLEIDWYYYDKTFTVAR